MKTIILFLASLVLTSTLARAADAPPPRQAPLKVAMFSGSTEYDSKDSLADFKKLLEEKYGATVTLNVIDEKGTRLTGIDGLDTADVAVFFTRRIKLAPDQVDRVKRFVASGKGVVGIRTASHGFQTWLGFDAEVLGGSYGNHYMKDESAAVTLNDAAKSHPLLAHVQPFTTTAKLYKNPKLADDVTLLLRAKNSTNTEPVAWARDAKAGERGRVFYTSLGAPEDFKNPSFQQLLLNAVQWTRPTPR